MRELHCPGWVGIQKEHFFPVFSLMISILLLFLKVFLFHLLINNWVFYVSFGFVGFLGFFSWLVGWLVAIWFSLCWFFGRNVDHHVNLSTLIFISSINRCQVTCELATTFLFGVVWCFCFVNWTLLTHVLCCYVTCTWSFRLVYKICSCQSILWGGKLLPRKICPWKTAVSLGGGGRGCMYSTYLDCRHLNKYRVV